MKQRCNPQFTTVLLIACLILAAANRAVSAPVSYHRQIWPILQARCQGCHQPASAGGQLVLTDYAAFAKGGEHGLTFQPGKPEASPVLDYLTGKRTLMPKGGPALPANDIALFRQWITEGAKDDTPTAKDPIDAEHPPVYTAPPVTTALAFSPDGKILAVSGYRETLLHRADTGEIVARLVGSAQKILSLAYSPDGKMLAAAGGTPAVFGEVQFWDTATNRPIHVVRTTFDTVFGAAFDSEGKQLAFGCADNSVRVITVPDGVQTLKFDNHSDWVFATTFATDNKHLLSAGRDQAIKLILLDGPSGSFIDDINTHTAALRCLVRLPKADQVVCAGDDGIPRLYKVYRTEARTMNQEDHNLLRAFDRQPGPATALAVSADGMVLAVGCEKGVVNLYRVTDGAHSATLSGQEGVVYAIAFSPDGKQVAVGGFDGLVRLYDTASGRLRKAFVPVPLSKPNSGQRVATRTRK